MKRCSYCAAYLDHSAFQVQNGRLSSHCKPCRAAIARDWYRKNKERAKARMKHYVATVPPDARTPNVRAAAPVDGKFLCKTCEQWKDGDDFHHNKTERQPSVCRTCYNARAAAYWWQNVYENRRKARIRDSKPAARAYKRQYYLLNVKKIKENRRLYREKHRERLAEYQREYRQKNLAQIAAKQKRYRQRRAERLNTVPKE